MNSRKIDPDSLGLKITKTSLLPELSKELRALIPTMVQEQTGQFASALAHEVRNPLTNINLAIDMLQSINMTPEQKVYVDIIMRGSGRINDLVNDLLTSYLPDKKQLEKYNIHELLDELIVMTKDRIMLKNIKVSKYYTSIDCKIMVNKQKLKLALTNIVINAIDAMEEGKGELKLLTKSINGKCVLEITDNGSGISDENLNNIFKPYFTNKPGGMGLGLSTTIDILLLNHATLAVKSKEGTGTSFIITFDRMDDYEPIVILK